MSRIPPMPTIGDLIRMFQLSAKKQLAQNFLLDLNLTRKIVSRAGRLVGARVCEVGPGPGGLTRAILEQSPATLALVEKDGRFVKLFSTLKEAFPKGTATTIHHTDVLRWDNGLMWGGEGLGSVCRGWEDPPPNAHILANLPFNVATPLFIRWLRSISERRGPWRIGRVRLTLTFQKEVGARMAAGIGDSDRCRLSAITQAFTEPQMEFLIPGAAFVPPPAVDVAVMSFEPLAEPLIRLPFPVVEKFFRHAFHNPNKHVIKAVMTLYPSALSGYMANEVFRTARVDPTLVAAQISNEELRDMAHVYHAQCRGTPGLFLFDYRRPRALEDLSKGPNSVPPLYEFEDEPCSGDDSFSAGPLTLSEAATNQT